MSSVGIMKMSLVILIVFESRGFNNTFPIGVVIKNIDNYIWEFDLFIKVLNLNDRLKI